MWPYWRFALAREKTASTDSAALRREVEALRAERRGSAKATEETEPVDHATPTPNASFDMNWDEVKQVIQELGDELEQVAHQRPLWGMVGAFVLGVLIGRTVSR